MPVVRYLFDFLTSITHCHPRLKVVCLFGILLPLPNRINDAFSADLFLHIRLAFAIIQPKTEKDLWISLLLDWFRNLCHTEFKTGGRGSRGGGRSGSQNAGICVSVARGGTGGEHKHWCHTHRFHRSPRKVRWVNWWVGSIVRSWGHSHHSSCSLLYSSTGIRYAPL